MEEVTVGVPICIYCTWSFLVCKTSAYIVLIHSVWQQVLARWRSKRSPLLGQEDQWMYAIWEAA